MGSCQSSNQRQNDLASNQEAALDSAARIAELAQRIDHVQLVEGANIAEAGRIKSSPQLHTAEADNGKLLQVPTASRSPSTSGGQARGSWACPSSGLFEVMPSTSDRSCDLLFVLTERRGDQTAAVAAMSYVSGGPGFVELAPPGTAHSLTGQEVFEALRGFPQASS